MMLLCSYIVYSRLFYSPRLLCCAGEKGGGGCPGRVYLRPHVQGGWRVSSIQEHETGQACRRQQDITRNVADVVMVTKGEKKEKAWQDKGSRGISQAQVLALFGEHGTPVMEGLKSGGLRHHLKAEYGVTATAKTCQRILRRYRNNPSCVNLDKRFSMLQDYEDAVCFLLSPLILLTFVVLSDSSNFFFAPC